jgi:hypothetical protein
MTDATAVVAGGGDAVVGGGAVVVVVAGIVVVVTGADLVWVVVVVVVATSTVTVRPEVAMRATIIAVPARISATITMTQLRSENFATAPLSPARQRAGWTDRPSSNTGPLRWAPKDHYANGVRAVLNQWWRMVSRGPEFRMGSPAVQTATLSARL